MLSEIGFLKNLGLKLLRSIVVTEDFRSSLFSECSGNWFETEWFSVGMSVFRQLMTCSNVTTRKLVEVSLTQHLVDIMSAVCIFVPKCRRKKRYSEPTETSFLYI